MFGSRGQIAITSPLKCISAPGFKVWAAAV
jgi:hypothetical protein